MATSEAQKRATMKHLAENYTELRFRVKKAEAEEIKTRAASKGMSLRAYLIDLIEKDKE